MIASGVSQYLHPDYLQPLPTTLDAKKSPLALLAQTCSSIGKDPTPSKSIIPPLDKKDKEAAEKAAAEDKRPSSLGSKGSSSESGRDSSSKPGFRTIPPKDIPPLVPIGSEKNIDSGNVASKSGSSLSSSSSSTSSSETNSLSTSSATSSHSLLSSGGSNSQRPVSATGSNSQRSASRSGSARDMTDYASCTPPASSSSSSFTRHSASASPPTSKISSAPPSSLSHASLGGVLPKPSVTHPSLLPGLGPHQLAAAYPHLSLLHSLDPAMQSYHNALAAHSGLGSLAAAAAMAQSSAAAAAAAAALKSGASALSPYVAYARVRTPSGATTLVPVCRDPFCTNCQLTLQNSHLSSACTAPGCSQCAHEKSLTSLTTGSLAGLGGSALPLLPPITSPSSLSSSMHGLSSLHSPLYPLAAHQGLGYVCSWVAGSEYCGKRFANSEELLQHLRTHTTSLASSAEASSLAATYSALGLHPGLAAAAAASHYPGSPLSPNSLRRAYPTSLSPVSSLLSASRYHPYKSPLGGVAPPAPSAQGLPAVGPYYSPYSLYGQRIGAAAVP